MPCSRGPARRRHRRFRLLRGTHRDSGRRSRWPGSAARTVLDERCARGPDRRSEYPRPPDQPRCRPVRARRRRRPRPHDVRAGGRRRRRGPSPRSRRLILADQRSRAGSGAVRAAKRQRRLRGSPIANARTSPVSLAAGASIEERRELPIDASDGLAAVGSANTTVRAEAVEAVAPDRITFLDILPTGATEEQRAGRSATRRDYRVLRPRPCPYTPEVGPSLGAGLRPDRREQCAPRIHRSPASGLLARCRSARRRARRRTSASGR